MVATGVPTGPCQPEQLAHLALDLMSSGALTEAAKDDVELSKHTLRFRIGIHVGQGYLQW